MENKQTEAFRYTYSAREQEEIRRIRSKYVPKSENTLEALQRLDASATGKATAAALILGVTGTLVMGTGMSCCMVWGGTWFVPGVFIGVAGMLLAALAYPAYVRILKKERERIAPEIIRLSDALLK